VSRSRTAALGLALAALTALAGCSGGNSGTDGDGVIHSTAPQCQSIRDKVRSMYQRAQRESDPDMDRPLSEDLLAANVTMVMNDCEAQPDRVVPCVDRAGGAAEIESDCLIPLDEEGAVDGDAIRPPR